MFETYTVPISHIMIYIYKLYISLYIYIYSMYTMILVIFSVFFLQKKKATSPVPHFSPSSAFFFCSWSCSVASTSCCCNSACLPSPDEPERRSAKGRDPVVSQSKLSRCFWSLWLFMVIYGNFIPIAMFKWEIKTGHLWLENLCQMGQNPVRWFHRKSNIQHPNLPDGLQTLGLRWNFCHR